MYLLKLPDEQFINRIRKTHQHRKWIGSALILFALLFYVTLRHILLPHFDMGVHLDRMGIWNNVPLFAPDDSQLTQRNLFVFSYGFILGAAFKGLYIYTMVMIFSGICLWLTPDRKTKMLIQLWDEKQNQAIGTQTDSDPV